MLTQVKIGIIFFKYEEHCIINKRESNNFTQNIALRIMGIAIITGKYIRYSVFLYQ